MNKLDEIAQKLNEDFKLVGMDIRKTTKSKKKTPPPQINNHELPPRKNGGQLLWR